MAIAQASQAEELRAAFLEESLDHALLLVDVHAKVVWVNTGAQRIFGGSAADFLGTDFSSYFVPEDVAKGIPEHELEIARSRGTVEDDRWTQRRDGSRFWASGTCYTLHNSDGELNGYAKIVQNRTDGKQQLEAFRNQAEDFGKREESKNRMISTLAHELRNPLAPLLNAARMMRAGMPIEYPLQVIERQIDFIRRLVDDLSETTSIHAGKVQLRRERLVLQEVLAQSVETVRPLVDRQEHALDVLLPPVPIHVEGDRARLQQIFTNLLVNSAKYTERGGRIWLKAMVEGSEAVIRVEDNGRGIAPDMLSQIFDLFVQVGGPVVPEGGVGIGLSVVKELVELHGGTVQANSDGVGKGSDFIVRLPACPDSQQ